jgi:6-pyruvoyl-tetrahydropterin synthase
MLKTNSKKAIENIKKYIINNFDFTNYADYTNEKEPTTFEAIAKFIYNCFIAEKRYNDGYGNHSEQQLFFDWCSGLPSVIDTCYFYNRSAIDDLAVILEETEAEKSKYSEADAEKLLTNLIYRELKKAVQKC